MHKTHRNVTGSDSTELAERQTEDQIKNLIYTEIDHQMAVLNKYQFRGLYIFRIASQF